MCKFADLCNTFCKKISVNLSDACTVVKTIEWKMIIIMRCKIKNWLIQYNNLLYQEILLIIALLIVRYGFGYSGYINQIFRNFVNNFLRKTQNAHYFLILIIIIFLIFILIKNYIKPKYLIFFILAFVSFLIIRFFDEIQNTLLNIFPNIIKIKTTISLNFITFIELLVLILLFSILYLFFRWLSSSDGIIIQPFDDLTINANQEKENLCNGRAIADLLAAEIHRIHHIHNLFEDGKLQIQTSSSLLSVCRENLDVRLIKGENLDKTLTQAGTISIADKTTLQIGYVLLVIRQLWPWGTVQIITGSIRKYGTKLRLSVRYEKNNHSYDIHAYKTEMKLNSSKQSPDMVLAEMVKETAYRITLDSSQKPLLTRSWEAFKYLTEAMSCVYRYERTKSLSHLDKAYNLCIEANKRDRNYQKVGDLLSAIGFLYLNRDEVEDAKKSLDKALEISPKSPYLQASLGNVYYLDGKYSKALEHYNYAQELEPSRPEVYIRIGMVNTILFQEYVELLLSKKALEKNEKGRRWYREENESLRKTREIINKYEKEYPQKEVEARRYFLDALILDHHNHAAQSALAWLDFLCYLKDEKLRKLLEQALNRLIIMSSDKKTYIDHSNEGIFWMYNNQIDKAYTSWYKALLICPNNQSYSTSSDKLHHIFYKLLTTQTEQNLIKATLDELEQILTSKTAFSPRVIDDLLGDARFILAKCINLQKNSNGNNDSQYLQTIQNSLTQFIGKLNKFGASSWIEHSIIGYKILGINPNLCVYLYLFYLFPD